MTAIPASKILACCEQAERPYFFDSLSHSTRSGSLQTTQFFPVGSEPVQVDNVTPAYAYTAQAGEYSENDIESSYER